MFKPCLLALVAASVISAAAPFAAAQDSRPSNTLQSSPRRINAAQRTRTQELTARLKLTADQQLKVQDVFESERSQIASVRQNTSFSQQDRRARVMEIHKTTYAQVRALLDSEQQKKWDAMQAVYEQSMQRPPGWTPR